MKRAEYLVALLMLATTICVGGNGARADETPFLSGLSGNLYLVKNGDLYIDTVDQNVLTSPIRSIAVSGWGSDIEVEGNYLYFVKGGNLYAVTIDGNTRTGNAQLVDAGGWEGDIEVNGNYLYLMKNDTLYAATISGSAKTSGLQVVDTGGWSGDMEVEGGYLYLMKNNALYAARIDGNTLTTGFQVVDTGGWSGDMEVEGGYLYLMKNDMLYASAINGNVLTGGFQVVGTGGWSGDLEVDGGNLYLMKNNTLYAAHINGNTLVPGFQEVDRGLVWEGDIEVEGNFVYLMKNNNLYAAVIDGDALVGNLVAMDTGGWSGDMEVEGGYLYLMKNDTLYAATIDGDTKTSGLQVVASGEWQGDVEIEGNYLYLLKNDTLYAATISGANLTSGLTVVGTGGWEGDLEVEGHNLYLMKNGNLYAATIDGANLTSGLSLVASGGWEGDIAFNDNVLPIWENELVFVNGPVITGANVRAANPNIPYNLAADPFLLTINDSLVCFFEAKAEYDNPSVTYPGEIWMAVSSEANFPAWNNFRRVSVDRGFGNNIHFSHPQAIVHNGFVYVFYNYNRYIDGSAGGTIFVRRSPVSSFFDGGGPQWSDETPIFVGSTGTNGWHHLVEFSIFQHQNIWYLLGITGDGVTDDKWIRGRWSFTFPGDWPPSTWQSQSTEMNPYPLISVDNYAWLNSIVELTYSKIDNTLLLMMGITQPVDGDYKISAFEMSSLSPSGISGTWLEDGPTQGISKTPWSLASHRAHAVLFKKKWIYAFDGKYIHTNDNWQIGFATKVLTTGND